MVARQALQLQIETSARIAGSLARLMKMSLMPGDGDLRLRVAVAASGRGSTFEAIARAAAGGVLPAEVALLFASRAGIEALEVAKAFGVPTVIMDPCSFPSDEAWDAALADELMDRGTDVLLLAGYLRNLGRITLSVLAGRILNTHPGLLPAFGGLGMYGDAVHEAVLAKGVRESGATIHLGVATSGRVGSACSRWFLS